MSMRFRHYSYVKFLLFARSWNDKKASPAALERGRLLKSTLKLHRYRRALSFGALQTHRRAVICRGVLDDGKA